MLIPLVVHQMGAINVRRIGPLCPLALLSIEWRQLPKYPSCRHLQKLEYNSEKVSETYKKAQKTEKSMSDAFFQAEYTSLKIYLFSK